MGTSLACILLPAGVCSPLDSSICSTRDLLGCRQGIDLFANGKGQRDGEVMVEGEEEETKNKMCMCYVHAPIP